MPKNRLRASRVRDPRIATRRTRAESLPLVSSTQKPESAFLCCIENPFRCGE